MKWTDFIFSGFLIWLAQLLLADFLSMEAAGEAVSRITASGVLPAGMEIMDNFMINAVNDLFGFDEYL